ncbi:MAG TPA: hypothetical protein VGI06_00075 [Acidimicrobiales bacterium]
MAASADTVSGSPADALQGRILAPADQLAHRVGRLRTRAGEGRLDRVLLLAGGVLMPLGILLVVLGWLGASHTVLVFEQIPYVVSGGLLGVGLVFIGGFVYFAYWQTLIVRESRVANRDLVAGLARIERLLADGAARPVGTAVAAPAPEPAATGAPVLVATPNGTMAHRPDCQVVAGRERLRRVTADDPTLTPCKICRPLG